MKLAVGQILEAMQYPPRTVVAVDIDTEIFVKVEAVEGEGSV